MSHAKTKLGLAIAAIVGSVSIAQAADYSISGSVNQMVRIADTDLSNNTETDVLDNSTNASRLDLSASDSFGGVDIKLHAQLRWDANASNGAVPGFNAGGNLNTEILDLSFTSGLGTISIGEGDGATRFTTRQDLSGTELADNFDVRRNNGVSAGGGQNWLGNRNARLRYDAPTVLGTNLSVSFGENDGYEVGATWDSETVGLSSDGLRWIAALGYQDSGIVDGDNTVGSLSAILGGGTSLTVGYGDGDASGADSDGTYIKLGQQFGDHAFSVSVGDNEVGGLDGESQSVAYQYNGGGGVQVYAAYTMLESDIANDDADVLISGIRVQF